MVFIDSGSGNFKLSIGKLEKILQHKNLLTGNYHEDGRCFYVAASRARRLLWIASLDKKIEHVFF
jgi:ATP-dependent exoDNAse (exonuclease V) beta subunit